VDRVILVVAAGARDIPARDDPADAHDPATTDLTILPLRVTGAWTLIS
jgi:hypothetical protein